MVANVFSFWAGYQLWFTSSPLKVETVGYDADCDLRAGPCKISLKNGATVSFSIEPRSIPVAEELQLEVSVSGQQVDEVVVDINGLVMKMPPNRVELKKVGNGHFTGKGGLSFCSRNAMEWETVVELDTENKKIKVPFRFITSSQDY
jgi:hypothetical protein